MPLAGTELEFSRASRSGAAPPSAMARRTRPVEYSPELRLDSAAVSTTIFMTVSTPGTPRA